MDDFCPQKAVLNIFGEIFQIQKGEKVDGSERFIHGGATTDFGSQAQVAPEELGDFRSHRFPVHEG